MDKLPDDIYKNTLHGQVEETRKAWNKFIAAVLLETKNSKVQNFFRRLIKDDDDTDKWS